MARVEDSDHGSDDTLGKGKRSPAPRLGCVVLIALAVVTGVVLFFLVRMSIGTIERISKDQLAADVAFGFERLRDEGKVPPEHKALFQSLYDVSQSPQASVWAVLLCRVTLIDTLGDGALTAQELKAAQAASAQFAQGKDLSEDQLKRFAAEFPSLKEPLRSAFELVLPEEEIAPTQ